MTIKYASIWKELKEKKKCTIAAPVPLHKRIIKAVTSEKYRDNGYRLAESMNRKRSKIVHIVDGARIRFILREFDILTGISFEELI